MPHHRMCRSEPHRHHQMSRRASFVRKITLMPTPVRHVFSNDSGSRPLSSSNFGSMMIQASAESDVGRIAEERRENQAAFMKILLKEHYETSKQKGARTRQKQKSEANKKTEWRMFTGGTFENRTASKSDIIKGESKRNGPDDVTIFGMTRLLFARFKTNSQWATISRK